ncbi:uroporphyrinogen decarboxylase family protein [Oscillospiraceae bacterium WX1]
MIIRKPGLYARAFSAFFKAISNSNNLIPYSCFTDICPYVRLFSDLQIENKYEKGAVIMTEKENIILAFDGKMPEKTPCFWTAAQLILSSAVKNIPTLGLTEGYDWFGVHWTATEDTGWMFSPTADKPHVLTDITKWREQVKFPDIEKIDWETAAANDMMFFNIDRENKVMDYYHGNGIFERLHFLMGFEEAMVAIIEEPEAVYDLMGAVADMYIAIAEKIDQYYKPDYYIFLDDYAHRLGLFVSPATFDKLFAPHLKRIVDFVGTTGMKFKMHCCGMQELLLDNFYKIGIRRFDPGQPCNDLVAMKKRYPDIAIMGGLDIQGVVDYPGVTEEQLRAEVRRCIREYGPMGGYIIFGATVALYMPEAYAPGQKMGIILDEYYKNVT